MASGPTLRERLHKAHDLIGEINQEKAVLRSKLDRSEEERKISQAQVEHYKQQRDILIGYIEAQRSDRAIPAAGADGYRPKTYLDEFLERIGADYYNQSF